MTMEEAAARQRSQWIGNDNGVLNFLAIASLKVTLSCLCLVAVSFWYCFHHITFFPCSLQEIISVLQSCGKCFCTKCTLTSCMYPPYVQESKNYGFLWSIKTYVSHYPVKTEIRFSYGSGTTPLGGTEDRGGYSGSDRVRVDYGSGYGDIKGGGNVDGY